MPDNPHLGNMVEGLAPRAFLSGLIPGHSPPPQVSSAEVARMACRLKLLDATRQPTVRGPN